MAAIVKEISLPLSADVLWEKVASVGEIHQLMPMITECRLDGDQRFCTTADGAMLEERILSVDNDRRRVAYTITKAPFPLEFHSASMQVSADGKGSRLTWITDVKPDELAGQMDPLFDQAIQGVKEKWS